MKFSSLERRRESLPETARVLNTAHVPEENHAPRLMIQPRLRFPSETCRWPLPVNGMSVPVGAGVVVVLVGL